MLQDSDSKIPSSNSANVNIPSVYSVEDGSYGMYDTAGHISIESEDGCGVYVNALKKLSLKTTMYEDTILRLCRM